MLVRTDGASSGAGGTFRFPAGTTIPPLGFISIGGPLSSATIKMNTFCSGASSSYLQTSLSRWFIDNAEAYVALYDANGNALDVVYWTFSAGQSNRWNNAAYPGLFNAPANIPSIPGTCANVASLAGPSAFSAGIVNYAGAGPNLGTVICRSQDGGSTWITNAASTINACNGTCTVANPFQTPATLIQPGCSSNSGSITITPSPAGAYTYTWSPNISSTNIATNLAGGTYSISVSLGGCQKDTVITLNSPITPTISVNSPTYCVGSSATLTASGANTYSWSPATGLSATSGATVTASPTVTTTYTITGTAGTCTASTTATLTVHSLPVITVNSGTICTGQQTLTLTVGGASSYTWSPATGLSTTSSATVTANPTVTTTYTITGTDANTCTNTINSLVTVNQTPTITANSPTICGGTNATLTASGASTYTWSPATGLSATSGATVTASPIVTTNYTITATDAKGCINTNTTSVAVVTTPTINVNNTAICIGSSATLTASGANTYSWSPATGLSATSGATVTASPTVTTTYTITGAAGTCTASTTATLTVHSLPVITVNSGTICAGQQTLTLTASGAYSYTWSPAIGLSATSGATVTANPTVTTTYTITGNDINTCTNTINSIVTVNQVPTVSISSTKDTICSGKNITLNASGATNYTWMPGGTNSLSLIISPVNSSTYSVIGSSLSCTSLLETYTIIVNPLPIVTGSVMPYSATCGANDGGIPKITISGGTPAYNYQWYQGTTPLPNATNDSLNNIGPGTYSVLITDSKGCVASSSATTFTVNGAGLVTASITPVYTQGEVPLNITFNNLSTGATTYTWNFGNGTTSTQQNPAAVIYTNSGTYSVTLIANNRNCSDTAYAIVVANVATSIIVPNIFSPNDDAINDAFFINCIGIKTLACNIYNRWGQLIYSITSINQSWNGEMNNGNKAVEGTYFYLLEASGFDGKNYSLKGNITLIR